MSGNNSSPAKKQSTDLQTVLAELKALRAELRTSRSRLLPVEAAAIYLGISPKSIRNGLGPKAVKRFAVKPVKVGGRVLFRREDLDQYVDRLGVRDDNG